MLKTRKTKMENGITLIALIITIVVLLILAAVAIASITKDYAVMMSIFKQELMNMVKK